MDDSVLDKLVAVENEIRETLKREREKIKKSLEQVRKNSEEALLKEETSLKEAFDISLRKKTLEAQEKASVILKDADEKARRLDSLSDDSLKKTVLRHLLNILPEDRHDS